MRSPKSRWLHSLRGQLTATYLAALLLTAGAAAVVITITLVWNDTTVTSRSLAAQAHWLELGLQFDAAGQPVALLDDHHAPWIYQGAPDDLKYRVLDAAGRVLLSSEANGRPLAAAGSAFDPDHALSDMAANGLQLDVLTVSNERAGVRHFIQVARSERMNALARRVLGVPALKAAVTMGIVSLLLFGGAVYITLCRTLRPLREVSEAAARIEPGNLSKRLATTDLPTEIAPLVEAFNLALDRLERGYRVQQEFLAGAAHELKTPLALIRGQIEMDGTADRATLLRDVDLMARQVHQLLHLAEVSEAQNYVYEATDLAAIASEVTAYLGRLADRRQVSLRVHADASGAPLTADRSALFVLMKNLVENAIHHSEPGGVVTLTLDANGMQVRDEGAGIATDDMPHLFARFWRGAGRRDDGAGLGLSICREIAATHGWDLVARNAAPGAEFSLRFRPA